MSRHVVVIGGGPAGMAAADAALTAGARVTLVDSNEALGGQYNRRIPAAFGVRRPLRIGHGYEASAMLAGRLATAVRCAYLPLTSVFRIERDHAAAEREQRRVVDTDATTEFAATNRARRPSSTAVTAEIPRTNTWTTVGELPLTIWIARGYEGTDREISALRCDALVIASGAYDRVVPFPGWDLPGVYTAGAAQTLAKTQRLAVGRTVLVSGTGPFLLPVAKSLLVAGASVPAVLDANPARRIRGEWTARPWELRHSAGKASELIEYAAAGLRHRVPLRTGRAVVAVAGDGRVEQATVARLDADWRIVAGSEETVAVDAVAVAHGFTPQTELAVAAGAVLDAAGFVAVDDVGRTSVSGVFAAGELTGIGGSQVAAIEGRVAGTAAAGVDPATDRRLMTRRQTAVQFTARLAAAHPIGVGAVEWAQPQTVVCRCEGTTRGELDAAAGTPVGDSWRTVKLGTRAGLGPCQGRMCGAAIAALRDARAGGSSGFADGKAAPGLAAAAPGGRPFAAPVRLIELAQLDGAPPPLLAGATEPSDPIKE